MPTPSQPETRDAPITIDASQARDRLHAILAALGCPEPVASSVAEHLVDASLCGVESHGIMRILSYIDEYQSGTWRADALPVLRRTGTGMPEVDGNGGIGIPALQLAVDELPKLTADGGIGAIAVRNVGHTGRHGAFAERAAEAGLLTFLVGGGNRTRWRQVAPYGGRTARLPTNPWCVGIPGGERGPVVLDFATSKIAGGWIDQARLTGSLLPENCLIDRDGRPSRDPQAYFDGGAILPAGEHKGYAMGLIGELIGEALLGPVETEMNWLLIGIDAKRYRDPERMQTIAEEILAELRACPPAQGFRQVEIPGERGRKRREAAAGRLNVPAAIWHKILEHAKALGIPDEPPCRTD